MAITPDRLEVPKKTQRRLEKRWHKLLDDCIDAAREAGVESPEIYIEADGGLYVTDGPSHEGHGEKTVPDCEVFSLAWPSRDYPSDVGAW